MLTWAGLLAIACLLISGLLSVLHLALLDLSRNRLEKLAARRGSKGQQRRIIRILADVPGHARCAAMVRVVFNLVAVVALVWWFASAEQALLNRAAISGGEPGQAPLVVEPRHALWGIVAGAVAMWIVSVLVPQAWARHAGEAAVLRMSGLARFVYLAMRPLAPAERAIDAAVRLLTGKHKNDQGAELEADLLSAVTEGERGGQIDEDQAAMIEAVIGLRQTSVGQIMTPRREVEALEMTNNLGAITAFVRKARHSRIPVYRAGGTLDDVVGFFYVKDLLKWLAGDTGGGSARGFDLKAILRPALFVPETKTVRELAQEFVDKRVHVAMVADEYGGAAGVVSLEDVIEEVFGEIQDEYEKAEDEPPRIEVKESQWLADIDARAAIIDVNEAIEGLGVSVPEGDDYDTLGGFVTTHMGRIPEINESFEVGDALVTVLEATPMRVVRVRIAVRPEVREAREKERREALAEHPAQPDAGQSEEPARGGK